MASLQQEAMDKRIIHTPREYQIELFERAKQKNTIVVLDTGKRPDAMMRATPDFL